MPEQQVYAHHAAPRAGRLRIGYLSSDFHDHATAYMIAELIERHDRDRFEVHGYSYGPDPGGHMRARLVSAFDRFTDIDALAHRAAAARIRADDIDILVDLKGHTYRARPKILAFRPAPVQVNYLGFPGTMGAPFIDYIVADDFIVPRDRQTLYAEKLAYLPDCYQPNDTRREIAAAPGRAACGLPAQGFVFCAFNNSFKITPAFFAIWMRLLQQVPGSVLWLLESNALVRRNLTAVAAAAGVDPDRLVFAPMLPHGQHLARHRHADLFLDTLPCNAHTTASDALWAGLPVLTCAGETFAGRVAGSIVPRRPACPNWSRIRRATMRPSRWPWRAIRRGLPAFAPASAPAAQTCRCSTSPSAPATSKRSTRAWPKPGAPASRPRRSRCNGHYVHGRSPRPIRSCISCWNAGGPNAYQSSPI